MRIMYRAVAAGVVKVRIYAIVCSLNRSEQFVRRAIDAGMVNGMGDERFRIGPAKIFTDGSSSGPTCATREPYTSAPNDYGILYYSQERIDEILGEAHRNGFQITAHAIGDRDRKSTRLNSSHANISYAVFCLKKKKKNIKV